MSRLLASVLVTAAFTGCTFNVVNPKVGGVVAEKGSSVDTQVVARADVNAQAVVTTAQPMASMAPASPNAVMPTYAPSSLAIVAGPAAPTPGSSPTAKPSPRETPGPAKLVLDGFEAHAMTVYGGDGSTDAKVTVFQPGDRVAIRPLLKNVGGYPALAPTVEPATDDPRAEVTLCYGGEQAPLAYYDIPVGQTQGPWHAGGGFCLDISKEWPHGKAINVILRVKDGNGNTWGLQLDIPVL